MSPSGKNPSARALEDFVSEAQDILEALGRDLMEIDSTPAGAELNPDTVNNLFRGMHTLKSLAGMFGMEQLADLAHQEEALLEEIRLGRIEPAREILNLLFESLDLFRESFILFAQSLLLFF